MTDTTMIIVGAGQAGANAAIELRQRGFTGRVVLIGSEIHAPYERPPLSKDALLKPDQVTLRLHPEDAYTKHDIELNLGVAAIRLDAEAHAVVLSDGRALRFDKLLLATGAEPRRLRQLDALGDVTHTLRTLDDARQIRERLQPGKRALLVGAGVIGLELASSVVDLGMEAMVIDPAPRAMTRNAPALLSEYLQHVHEARGVRFRFGASVGEANLENGRAALTLTNGEHLEGDVVIYGIGVAADTALAEAAGLATDRGGIVVDPYCRTTHADIFAAGDVAIQQGAVGRRRRIETWENANQQAAQAACAMLGLEAPAPAAPWFWTDQCGLNVQFVGDMAASEWVVRGTLGQPPFMLFGLDRGVLVAAITINQGRDMRSARELIAARARPDMAALANPKMNLRALAKDAAPARPETVHSILA